MGGGGGGGGHGVSGLEGERGPRRRFGRGAVAVWLGSSQGTQLPDWAWRVAMARSDVVSKRDVRLTVGMVVLGR
jgi:hypothetical protein